MTPVSLVTNDELDDVWERLEDEIESVRRSIVLLQDDIRELKGKK